MYSVLIMSAGSSARMGGVDKQMLSLRGKTVLQRSIEAFLEIPEISEIFVVTSPERAGEYSNFVGTFASERVQVIGCGGSTRQQSVFAGMNAVSENAKYVAIHDGARPLVTPHLIRKVFADACQYGAAIPAVPVKDTIKVSGPGGMVLQTVERSTLRQVQTPQVFDRSAYLAAMEEAIRKQLDFTDDAQLFELTGRQVHLTEGEEENLKITTPADLPAAEAILSRRINQGKENADMRIGQGYDVHKLVENRQLIIGGVNIPHQTGLLGHSDADVLLHAIMDAVLGALSLGDIGKHFPDTDPAFKGADSRKLLRHVCKLAEDAGYRLGNLDATIIAQAPKMRPYIDQMRENIAQDLQVPVSVVNVKATTEEKLGFTGREEGISASAVCLMLPR
ncbi:MAG: 2-C-methyl-D-erythritol 2,4-cyclodiphosphate synthase [Candidatus Merdivicinus sp.]|jgi:2-C-methyl-D-erythritol 2,4-cyclodiphosphate synthase/2-C-methyl-D-erythritol 4-phosphate cytidylyltransferase